MRGPCVSCVYVELRYILRVVPYIDMKLVLRLQEDDEEGDSDDKAPVTVVRCFV